VGFSFVHVPCFTSYATEWSGGSIINLVGLPGFDSSQASGINNAGQVVGDSTFFFGIGSGTEHATEWSGGSVINLGGLPGSTDSAALTASTTPGRRWERALSAATTSPPSGAAAA
jgi:probable HAF family extracellular repeat protein